MKNRHFLKLAMAGLALLSLSGCASAQYNPSTTPSTITMSMVTTKNINVNASQQSSPVGLEVFELEDDSLFNAATYHQLVSNSRQALESNFVRVYDYMLVPNHFKFVDPINLNANTRYIGVIALFADSDNSDWKHIIQVHPMGREYHLLVYINKNKVTLKKVQ